MRKSEFNKLLGKTSIGSKGPGDGATRRAAELYFVKGITNMAECARLAGCHRNNARRTIETIKGIMAENGLESVVVMVPKGKKTAIENLAAELRKGS